MLVSSEIKDRICYVEMQNPEHFNCLSEQMCNELIDALKFGYDSECVGIVLKAQTKRGVWSAGHDINELPQDGTDPLAFSVPMEKLLRKVQDTFIPVIACVSGTVWGGRMTTVLVTTGGATRASGTDTTSGFGGFWGVRGV